jgi:hypothetical protein
MPVSIKRFVFSLVYALMFVPPFVAVSQTSQSAPTPAAASAPTVVPALVPYSGVALKSDGSPLSGESSITFLIFKDETGGEPLFSETQSVILDPAGHYKVNLGATSTNGISADLFSTGEARWLEVQIAGQAPQARVLLVSVPYAMKAADAATLGGLPASAFVLASQTKPAAGLNTAQPEVTSTVTTTGGTAGYVPEFTGASTIANSPIFVKGSNVGIGTTNPAFSLHVVGDTVLNGGLAVIGNSFYEGPAVVFPIGTATTATGYNSQPFKMSTSAWNSTKNSAVSPRFQWQAEVQGNNTATPSATLNLLSSTSSASPAETGFHFNANGTMNFAPGQTFPSTGTITGVTAGTALTGGGTTGNVTLNLDTTKVPLLGTANTFVGNQSVTGTVSASSVFGYATATTGVVNGVFGGTNSSTNYAAGVNGFENATTGVVYGVSGGTNSTSGAGVSGNEGATTGQVYGVLGVTRSTGTNAAGVNGFEGATTGVVYGVIGGTTSSTSGAAGVNGESSAATGQVFGVNGTANSTGNGAAGLHGYEGAATGTVYGVMGQTASSGNGAAGVFGSANATTGGTYGVFGATNSSAGVGTFGVNNSTTGGNGVVGGANGTSNSTAGVYGFENSTTGVVYGVAGSTSSSTGGAAAVNGYEGATTGTVFGVQGNTSSSGNGAAGVWGNAAATTGQVFGVSGSAASTTNGAAGVNGFEVATTGVGYGVNGSASSTTNGAAGVNAYESAATGLVFGVNAATNSTTDFAAAVHATEGAASGLVIGVDAHVSSSSNFAAGVSGYESATTGLVYGVYGGTASSEGVAVQGEDRSLTGGTAVSGITRATSGVGNGVIGQASDTTGLNFGVQGIAGVNGVGVQGSSPHVAVAGFNQVCGDSGCTISSGLAGQFVTGTGGTILQGLSGASLTSTNQVFYVDSSGNGYYAGNLNVTGKLSKGSGSFKIDDPLDPANKYLSHSFVESPDMMNVYNGNITTDKHGLATVELPEYFDALNRDFRYQLTVMGQFAQAIVAREIAHNRFVIRTSKPGVKVSWQVTGIRQDAYANANRIPVEEDKPAGERGYYLHPEVFGQPASKGIVAAGRSGANSEAVATLSSPQ